MEENRVQPVNLRAIEYLAELGLLFTDAQSWPGRPVTTFSW